MAVVRCSYDTNRKKLSDIIPLKSPLSMYIEPTKRCNFKCFYCMHATRGEIGGILEQSGYTCTDLSFDFFKKIADDIIQFNELPKRICFSGLGEPLMNPLLPEMVAHLRTRGYDGRVDIITNGTLLNPALSQKLVRAGVSRIQISVQGLSGEAYQKNCGVRIDYNQFCRNLDYLFAHKENTQIYIKIIDALLEDKRNRESFLETFSKASDQIFVEHLIVMEQQMGDHGGRVDYSRNLNNEPIVHRDVCPVCFYHLQVTKEGYTFPCPIPGLPSQFSMGNATEQSLSEIWNSERRRGFLRKQLSKQRKNMTPCGTCMACTAVMDSNECLEDVSPGILGK